MEDGPAPPNKRRLVLFTAMLMGGLVFSQITASHFSPATYSLWSKATGILTMFCLSFLMINVGYEFDIDKSKLKSYGLDYVVAMSAAGLPWIFVACWLHWMLPGAMAWGPALLMARFAAPTSAGILFSMLEAAGLKETWLFKKARILAIFDDLDTILLMIPLKMFLVGFHPELFADAVFVTLLLTVAWKKLHALRLPSSNRWTLLYAGIITAACEGLAFYTSGKLHFEVLLPAFVIGCITKEEEMCDEECEIARVKGEVVKTTLTTFFMLLVGLSMPSLFNTGSTMSAMAIAGHVLVVTILMILGKMMLLGCYRQESDLRTRLALSLGMCPRGEVGAGVIAVSLGLGVRGPAVTVAVLSLAVNLLLSSGFIMAIEKLVVGHPEPGSKLSASVGATDAAAFGRSGIRRRGGFAIAGQTKGLGLGLGMQRRPLPVGPAALGGVPGRLFVSQQPRAAGPQLPRAAPWSPPAASGIAVKVPSPPPAFGVQAVSAVVAVAAAIGSKFRRRRGSR